MSLLSRFRYAITTPRWTFRRVTDSATATILLASILTGIAAAYLGSAFLWFVCGWLARSAYVFRHPDSNPYTQIERDNNARN